jgi:hypothetical protein
LRSRASLQSPPVCTALGFRLPQQQPPRVPSRASRSSTQLLARSLSRLCLRSGGADRLAHRFSRLLGRASGAAVRNDSYLTSVAAGALYLAPSSAAAATASFALTGLSVVVAVALAAVRSGGPQERRRDPLASSLSRRRGTPLWGFVCRGSRRHVCPLELLSRRRRRSCAHSLERASEAAARTRASLQSPPACTALGFVCRSSSRRACPLGLLSRRRRRSCAHSIERASEAAARARASLSRRRRALLWAFVRRSSSRRACPLGLLGRRRRRSPARLLGRISGAAIRSTHDASQF